MRHNETTYVFGTVVVSTAILTSVPCLTTPRRVELLAEPAQIMAREYDDQKQSFIPLGIYIGHAALVLFSTGLVASTVYRSYLALPPSAYTRHRQPERTSCIRIFLGLAGVSLLFAFYWAATCNYLSCKVWANERGIQLPDSILGYNGAPHGGQYLGRLLELSRWLGETPVYREFFEIVAEDPRRYWWRQQVGLAAISWSLLLAIEGYRRKISHLWAFMLISQLVNMSFAQNLFYVALLVTPTSLPDNVKDITRSGMVSPDSRLLRWKQRIVTSNPDGWTPHPLFYYVFALGGFTATVLAPIAANTSSFMNVALASRAFLFVPLTLPYLLPRKCGTIALPSQEASGAFKPLFRFTAISSFLLHVGFTAQALASSTSVPHRHKISGTSGSIFSSASVEVVAKALSSFAEHPAVGAAAWDTLLTALSLGTWASTRGLDPQQILALAGLWTSNKAKSLPRLADQVLENVKLEANHVPESSGIAHVSKNAEIQTPPRKRGRPRKTLEKKDEGKGEGEETKMFGCKKAEETADEVYKPTRATLRDTNSHVDEDEEEDWESGALVWGMMAIFGLGMTSAGVFGAMVV